MDPILSIIKYLMEKKNIVNNDESIDSFFENGISFPQFVSSIFNVDQIPNTHKNPKLIFHKKENNNNTILYLCKNNEYMQRYNPNIETIKGKIHLLLMILTKICFTMSIHDIINKSNIILQKKNIRFQSKSELLNPSFLLILLNILSDYAVDIISDINESNFDNIMKKNFQIANVPFLINYDCLIINELQDIYFIQIQIIFDIFSNKINELSQNLIVEDSLSQKNQIKTKKSMHLPCNDEIVDIIKSKTGFKFKKIDVDYLENYYNKKTVNSESKEQISKNCLDKENNLNKEINTKEDENKQEKGNNLDGNTNQQNESNSVNLSSSVTNLIMNDDKQNPDTDNSNLDNNSQNIHILKDNITKNEIKKQITESLSVKESLSENNLLINNDNDDYNQEKTKNIESINEETNLGENNIKVKSIISKDKKKLNKAKSEKFSSSEIKIIKDEGNKIKHAFSANPIIQNFEEYENYEIGEKVECIEQKSDKFGEDEQLEEESLLMTINFLTQQLFPDEKISFTSFADTLKNDFIPKFVMKFFNIPSIDNVDSSQSLVNESMVTKANIKNFESVVHFLREKEINFNFLEFCFNNRDEREASSKLFFTNFLNFFFIKETKEEMIERLNIITSNSCSLSSIYKFPIYNLLIEFMKFLSNKSNRLELGFQKMYEECFGDFKIPMVFTSKNWILYDHDKVFPDSYFYQLQFLFNIWDSRSKSFKCAEFLFITLEKIKKIKVPRYDIITSSINAKKASLESSNIISNLHNELIETEINDSNDGKIDNYTENEIQKEQIPITFKERQEKENKNNKMQIKNGQKEIQNISNIDETNAFWNPPNDLFILENDIFEIKLRPNEQPFDYRKFIDGAIKNDKALKKMNILNKNNKDVDSPSKQSKFLKNMRFETELYKILTFDESENKWDYNYQVFNKFCEDKRIDIEGSQTPLVFFGNSNEEDIISINSQFIIGQNPNIKDDDQIFVYAFCEKNLAMLHVKYDNSIYNTLLNRIKPIFLLLHIPKSKQNIPNFPIIIFQLNLFLSLISDLALVVINEDKIPEQIGYFKFIDSIIQSNTLNQNDNQEKEEINEYSVKFKYSDINIIFIVKNSSCEYNNDLGRIVRNNTNFNKIINGFKLKPKINLLDINNKESYEIFLNEITTILSYSQTNISIIKDNLNFLHFTMLSTGYLKFRSEFNNKKILLSMLEKRYEQIKSNSKEKSSSDVISQLYREINIFSPIFDTIFIQECQSLLVSLRFNASKIYNSFFASELKKSADLYFAKIKDSIKNISYLSYDKMGTFVRNYQNFIRNEFFDIIKSKTEDSMLSFVYEDNIDVLNSLIDNAEERINALFSAIRYNIEKKKKIIQNDAKDSAKTKTNYVLKETENLREIKISVEVNKDLTSKIEQDF